MTARDHMPGYPAALDNEDLRAMPRKPYPLGIPVRVKARAAKRLRDFVEDVMPPELLKPFDPLTVTHMTRSDVPGVLIAAGAAEVERSLDRIVEAGHDPRGAAAAIRARALREGEDEIVDTIDAFTRYRDRREAQAMTAAEDRQRSFEYQQKAEQTIRDYANAQQAKSRSDGAPWQAQATNLHPNAGQVMQGCIDAQEMYGDRFKGYALIGTEQPQTLEQTKAEMANYVAQSLHLDPRIRRNRLLADINHDRCPF